LTIFDKQDMTSNVKDARSLATTLTSCMNRASKGSRGRGHVGLKFPRVVQRVDVDVGARLQEVGPIEERVVDRCPSPVPPHRLRRVLAVSNLDFSPKPRTLLGANDK
jgi:hypothetical protein